MLRRCNRIVAIALQIYYTQPASTGAPSPNTPAISMPLTQRTMRRTVPPARKSPAVSMPLMRPSMRRTMPLARKSPPVSVPSIRHQCRPHKNHPPYQCHQFAINSAHSADRTKIATRINAINTINSAHNAARTKITRQNTAFDTSASRIYNASKRPVSAIWRGGGNLSACAAQRNPHERRLPMQNLRMEIYGDYA